MYNSTETFRKKVVLIKFFLSYWIASYFIWLDLTFRLLDLSSTKKEGEGQEKEQEQKQNKNKKNMNMNVNKEIRGGGKGEKQRQ